MFFDDKSLRKVQVLFQQASLQIEYLVAIEAMEMVVMLFVGQFIAAALPRQIHHLQNLILDHIIEGAVDGGHSQVRDVIPGKGQNLMRTQRTGISAENLFDGDLLFGSTLTGHFYAMPVRPRLVNDAPFEGKCF